MLQLKSLNTQLTDLKMDFDKAIMQVSSFGEVKKIYAQIKEIERHIADRQIELLKAGRMKSKKTAVV